MKILAIAFLAIVIVSIVMFVKRVRQDQKYWKQIHNVTNPLGLWIALFPDDLLEKGTHENLILTLTILGGCIMLSGLFYGQKMKTKYAEAQ